MTIVPFETAGFVRPMRFLQRTSVRIVRRDATVPRRPDYEGRLL